MLARKLKILTLLFVCFSSFFLVLGKTLKKTDQKKNTNTVTVQEKWQTRFLEEIAKWPHVKVEGYGLFSQSGWADNGQHFVMVSKDGSCQWFIAKPGATDISNRIDCNVVDLNPCLDALNSLKTLKDVQAHALDGIQYGFVYAVKEDKAVEVKHKVFMNNPGLVDEGKAHSKAIDAFLSCEKTAFEKKGSK